MTNEWSDYIPTSALQLGTDNIVMWETMHQNADMDLFRMQISQERQMIQHHLPEECFVFSEATRLFQLAGVARSKQSFHTAALKQRLSH